MHVRRARASLVRHYLSHFHRRVETALVQILAQDVYLCRRHRQ